MQPEKKNKYLVEKKKKGEKILCIFENKMGFFESIFTNIKPHPVGKNARMHTIKSINESWHIEERVIMIARTPMKRNALRSLNTRW